jgi:hypothetical protein
LAEVDPVGRCRFWIESIIRIHPGANPALGCSPGEKGQGEAGASRRCGSRYLADGSHRKAAIQQPVGFFNACRRDLADSTWSWRQRRGKAACEGVFDLEAKGCSCGHGEGAFFSPFLRLDSLDSWSVVKATSMDFSVSR